MANNIKGITIELNADTKSFNKSLRGINDESKKLQTELKAVDRALKLDPKNIELLKQKQDLLTRATGESKDALNALKSSKDKADKDMANGTEINQEQYRKLQREIAFAEDNVKKLEKTSKKSFESASAGLEKFGGKAEAAGKKFMPASVAASAVGVASVKMAIDFEDAMAKVSTIADTTRVPMETLEKSIVDLSNQTGISSTLIADDVYNAISAGQNTADAVNFVTNSTKLAKAGFAESSQSLDLLTTIMNAYGLEAEKVGGISDVLIQVQNKGKTTVAELSSNMGKIIPTAKANGVVLEQLGASYAIMTSKGIATAETTTYLNSMMNELGKSGSTSSDILKAETGKSFSELMANGKSLADVLEILKNAADENGLSMGDMFGSAEAGKAALVLLGDGAETFNSSVKDMQNSAGVTDEAFEKMQTTSQKAKESINRLKNTSIELGDTILTMLAPILEKISGMLKSVSDKFAGLTDGQKKAIVSILGVIAVIAPLLIIIGKMSTGIGAIIKTGAAVIGIFTAKAAAATADATATTTAAVATTAFNASILLIPLAIVALIAIFVVLWNKCEGFRNFFIGLGNTIKEIAHGFVEVWTVTVPNAITTAFSWVVNKFKELWQGIKDVFSGVGAFFGGIWETIKEKFTSIGSSIGNAMGGAFKAVVNSVISFAENTINGFIKAINFALKMINKIPGVDINPLKTLNIPAMNIGTRYLPSDMLIQAHKGEMIVPRSENPYANSGGQVMPQGNTNININNQSLSAQQIIRLIKQEVGAI